jgi:hypothetical protein
MNGLPIALGNALAKVRRAIERDDLVPIVGPAFASPHLPDTWEVVDGIGTGAYDELKHDVREALARNDLLAAIAAIETKGRGLISEAVDRTHKTPGVSRPDVFSALASLPVRHFVTFGHDPWLKLALAERSGAPPRVVCADEPSVLAGLGPASGPALVMLHGDPERRGSCVLARSGYARLGVGSYGDVLRSLLGGRRVLLLGFGSDDPHLGALLDDWSAIVGEDASVHSAPRHFFLGTWISEADRTRLAHRGVRAIEVPPGFKLAMVLRRLGPEVPAEAPGTLRRKAVAPGANEPEVVRAGLESALREAETALGRSEEERFTLEGRLRGRDAHVKRLEERSTELEARVRELEKALAVVSR